MLTQKNNPSTSPFQYHLYEKRQKLGDERFDKSILTHFKLLKSVHFQTSEDDPRNHQFLIQCQKVLKAQNRLSKINFTLATDTPTQNKLLLSTIQHFSSLSSLNLQLSSFETISQDLLLKNLTTLKNLRHLNLYFNYCAVDDPKILKRIIKAIRKLGKISSLYLRFFSCQGLTPSHYSILLSNFAKMIQLNTLELCFMSSFSLENEDIERLAFFLPKLVLLTKLELVFGEKIIIFGSTLVRLFKAIQSLKNLSDLALILQTCELAHEGSILESLKCLAGNSIEKLSLSLFENSSYENLRELIETLLGLPLLKNLFLSLVNWSRFTDEHMANFGSVLASLVWLTSLNLYFPSSMKNPNIVQVISSAVKPLQNLVSLGLSLRFSHEIGDFHVLFENFKYLKSLKYLSVQITERTEMTDTSLGVLAESLKGMTFLKKLSLDFTKAFLITNEGFEALCSGIQENLSKLSSLSLKFEGSQNINEKVLGKFEETLQSLTLLKSVKLHFMKFWNVAGFQEMAKVLAKMKCLEKIKWSFPHSEWDLNALRKINNRVNIDYIYY